MLISHHLFTVHQQRSTHLVHKLFEALALEAALEVVDLGE